MTTDKYLISHDIKPSVQRMAIMDYLKTHKTHPTADEIYNALSTDIPTLSKTTVYNTLKLFTDHGAALSISIEEKNVRFDGDISQHAHFICLECGCICDVRAEQPEWNSVRDTGEFIITETHLYYKGYCKRCREEAGTKTEIK